MQKIQAGAAVLTALLTLACGGGDGPSLEIEAVEPDRGSTLGGQTLTIDGKGFLAGPPTNVVFGDRSAPAVTPLGDGRLEVTTPPSASPGTVSVTVFNQSGVALAEDAFTYNDLPAVEAVDPPSVPHDQGGTVTVEGSGFMEHDPGLTAVRFGELELDEVTVLSDSEIEVAVPPNEPLEVVDVSVVNANGTGTAKDAFRWRADGLVAMSTCCSMAFRKLLFIDVETGEVTTIGSDPLGEGKIGGGGSNELPGSISGLAFAPDGTLYGVESHERNLVTVHTGSGRMTRVGPLETSTNVPDITFVDGDLFGTDKGSSTIGTIDLETGEFTAVPDMPASFGSSGSGLASDGEGRLIYSSGDDLHSVDLEGGTLSEPIADFADLSTLNSLTFHRGELYATERGGAQTILWKLDPEEVTFTPIAALPGRIDALASTEQQ